MKTCLIDNCDGKHVAKGFCIRHYGQFRHYGKILPRFANDPNEIAVNDSVCKIFLYNNKGIKITETLIDVEDYPKVKPYKWHISTKGYAVTTIVTKNKKRKLLFLHHLILKPNPPVSPFIDHKNRDKLDNRKLNLRRCSQSQNSANSIKPKTNKSGFKGVSWNKQMNKWRAVIGHNRKMIRIGWFEKKEDAALAYNETAKKIYGEFAKLNAVNV